MKLWAKKALMHELAHAWHITNWPESHPPIVNAYQNAKRVEFYTNVKDIKGENIPKAYAIKNQLDYFAELLAIYFSRWIFSFMKSMKAGSALWMKKAVNNGFFRVMLCLIF